MTNRDDPSFVEILEDIELPLPDKGFAFAAQAFDMLMDFLYKIHDFLLRSRDGGSND